MFEPIADPARARILVTNDDGINAPGLATLEGIASALSGDVWTVAPETEQSAAAHALTLRRPLRLRRVDERSYAVDGTPTDCVLLAVRHLLTDRRPTLMLSGVNRGGNLGEDVTYSGTVAAAIEGTLLGVPSVALSQLAGPHDAVRWETARAWGPDLLRRVTARGWPAQVLININFPDRAPDDVTGVVAAREGRRAPGGDAVERVDPRGEPYIWIGVQGDEEAGTPGTDISAVTGGAVAVTPLSVELTHFETLADLETICP